MRRGLGLAGAIAALALALACQEKLATPTDCPTFCPGGSLDIRDTVLLPISGSDSTFTGYLPQDQVPALLASSGLSAGEARIFARFPKRPDSATVDGVVVPYTVDSVTLTFNVVARDSLVHGLKLYVHRLPITVDTTTPLAEIDAGLTPATLIDSVLIPDTLKTGAVRALLTEEELDRITPPPDDSGRFAIGVRVGAGEATGVRISSAFGSAGPPLFTTYVHAAVTDTAKQRQNFALGAEVSNYVIEPPPIPSDLLVLGGKSGSRTIMRFALPKVIKDSAALLRATLELTLAGPIKGLPNDPGVLQILGVLVDLGSKSTPVGTVAATTILETGRTGVLSVDMAGVVTGWFGTGSQPQALLLGVNPEGGSFARPEFFSSLAAAGTTPRLRITYAYATHPGHP